MIPGFCNLFHPDKQALIKEEMTYLIIRLDEEPANPKVPVAHTNRVT